MNQKILFVTLAALALMNIVPALASPSQGAHYAGAGIVVTEFSSQNIQILDNGAVVCKDSDNDGTLDQGAGGVCIPFGTLYDPQPPVGHFANAIQVSDLQHDTVFQVCFDADADGFCTGGNDVDAGTVVEPASCIGDIIFYSHGSDGLAEVDHNPLYIPDWVESSYWATCGFPSYNGFAGYVVMICTGLHDNEMFTNLHSHHASTGYVQTTWIDDSAPGATESGNYCGAPTATKAYDVVW